MVHWVLLRAVCIGSVQAETAEPVMRVDSAVMRPVSHSAARQKNARARGMTPPADPSETFHGTKRVRGTTAAAAASCASNVPSLLVAVS